MAARLNVSKAVDPATKTLLKRRWACMTWLICHCEYKGRRRAVVSSRSWTELFFLDEAVALSAGHRPCFVCRREAAERFRNSWATARGERHPSAKAIDAILHRERIDKRGRQRIHPIPWPLLALPPWSDGCSSGVGIYAVLSASLSMDK
jgi:hypothetical protein